MLFHAQLVLCPYHLPVNPPLLEQIDMATLLEQLSAFSQDKNYICILHRRQSMRHYDHGTALAGALKRRLDEFLALRIQRAGSLVEQKDIWIANEGTSDGNALLLTAGKRHTTRADVGVVSFRERDNEIVDGGVSAGLVELIVGDDGIVYAEEDILSKCSCEAG